MSLSYYDVYCYMFIAALLICLYTLGQAVYRRITYDPQTAWNNRSTWESYFKHDEPITRLKKLQHQYHLANYETKRSLHMKIVQQVVLTLSVIVGLWSNYNGMMLIHQGITNFLSIIWANARVSVPFLTLIMLLEYWLRIRNRRTITVLGARAQHDIEESVFRREDKAEENQGEGWSSAPVFHIEAVGFKENKR